jgi:flagellar biosynthetic protein FliR
VLNIQITDLTTLVAFWLAFTRWITIIIQLPMLGDMSIPMIVKVLASLLITYAFFPYISGEVIKDIHYLGVDNFWALTLYHSVVGLTIGYMVKSIMNIFIASGSIITQQIGFAAISYFDPSSSQQIGPFEKLIQWTVLIMIVMSGALLPMFRGVFESFFTIHIYDWGKLAHSPEFFIGFFKSIFLSALLLASPLIFTNILIMTVLGIIGRTVPQMNIIMVSFAVNIGMGLLVFAAGSDEFFQVAFKMYTEKLGEWFQFIT